MSQPVPNRAARRARGGESPGLQIELGDQTYVVRQSDLTPRLVAELRRETGFAGWVGLMQAVRAGMDLDVLAALVWLSRRIAGEAVLFDVVLDSMSYDTEVRISTEDKRKVGPAGDAPEGASPEA